VLVLVLALHAGFIAALLTLTRSGSPDIEGHPIELMQLPATVQPVRSLKLARPERSATLIAISPPLLPSFAAPGAAGSAAAADGQGGGVDWAAEARRALQAFEIRNHPPASYSSVSRDAADDPGWSRGQHHAGEKFKTPNGDWIVWLDSNCYQVASAESIGYAQGAALSRIICQEGTPHGVPNPAGDAP
jgi:hypothetical protein